MISGQSLTCPKGTSLTFEIDMDTGSDLTGATAQWALAESWFDQAKVYLTKTGTADGLFIGQDAGVWKITVNLASTDTLDVPSGLLYHDCKVLLQNGDVEDVANGPFFLDPSVNVLNSNAPLTRNLYGAQTVGQLAQVAGAAHAGLADWFVDSVAGSDSNNGTAQGTPFATLAAISTAISANPTKTSVAVKRGSSFRESLSTSVTNLLDYGSTADPVPVIDGSNVITGWVADGTNANVWNKTGVSNDAFGTDRLTIYEDGVLLSRVANAATCSSTLGSFVDKTGADGATWTLQIHTSNSSNPNTNGKTYEAAVRANAVLLGDNATATGIEGKRVLAAGGAVKCLTNATMSRLLSVDGTKHNMYIGTGTMTDCIAFRSDAPTSYEPSSTYFVGHVTDATGLSITFRRCGALSGNSTLGGGNVGVITHDDAGHYYSTITKEQLWAANILVGSSPQADTVNLDGLYTVDCNTPIGITTDAGTFDHLQVNETIFGPGPIIPTGKTGSGAALIKVRNSVFYNVGSNDLVFKPTTDFNGSTLEITNCVIYTTGGRPLINNISSWSSGTLRVNNCIFVAVGLFEGTGYGGISLGIPPGVTYEANHNVFINRPSGLYLYVGGTQYDTLSAWQTATGQDAASLSFPLSELTNVFSGTVANGDFRLQSTTTGSAIAAISAGPQNHWDWSTRSVVSGPPQRWPVVPKTLSDSIAYVGNPTGWTW